MNTQPELWTWQPLRLAGRSMIAVKRGGRLVTVLGPHEVDAAWGLCSVRNLAAGAPRRLLGNNSQQRVRGGPMTFAYYSDPEREEDGLHESTDRISTGFRPRRKGGRIRAVWAMRRVRLAPRRGVEGRSARRTARKTLCVRTNILISYSRAK